GRDGKLRAGVVGSVREFRDEDWHPEPNVPIAGRSAFTLHEARDGTIWMGFGLVIPGAAVYRDGAWRRLEGGPWQRAAAASFAETTDGKLWFASKKGLFLEKDDECHEVSGRLPMRTFWPVLADGHGGLWLGTLGEGLLHFSPQDTQP